MQGLLERGLMTCSTAFTVNHFFLSSTHINRSDIFGAFFFFFNHIRFNNFFWKADSLATIRGGYTATSSQL